MVTLKVNPFRDFEISDFHYHEKRFSAFISHSKLPIAFESVLHFIEDIPEEGFPSKQDIMDVCSPFFTQLMSETLFSLFYREDEKFGFDQVSQRWYVVNPDGTLTYDDGEGAESNEEPQNDLL